MSPCRTGAGWRCWAGTRSALHCAARERWIGWSSLQRRARLFLVVGNTRFLILPQASGQRCLASRVLGLSLRRLARDWQALHGHPIVLAESFVDPARFAGTCYRAANWIEVGLTRGYGRARGTLNYVRHGAPKRGVRVPVAARRAAAVAGRAAAARMAALETENETQQPSAGVPAASPASGARPARQAWSALPAADRADDRARRAPGRLPDPDRDLRLPGAP